MSERGHRGRVLYVGQAYYNAWYLSRALRERGWRADVFNWDASPETDLYYHGEDYRMESRGLSDLPRQLLFYQWTLRNYDIFHFSNAHAISFGGKLQGWFERRFGAGSEIRLLKRLGKKVVYANNGCLDGVSQTSFASWGDRPVCTDCPWREVPSICSDQRNLAWGRFRNDVADFQILLGGNRIDYNLDPTVHEVPEFYCLDPDFWRPDLLVPSNYRLPLSESTVKIYHAVGNASSRSEIGTNRNVKSTHVYVPLVEQLKREGEDVELVFFEEVPNRQLRFYQAQADIVVDMLTYGFFGASAREAMMLGKPVVCYLRPEWLEQMRAEIPDYVDELPIVSATPETVRDVLLDLIRNPEKRREIGRRSREFAVKWHSAEAAGERFDAIYSGLLAGRPGTESFPVIRGESVTLAPLRNEDVEPLFEWINDRELVLLNARYQPVHESDHAGWFEAIRQRDDVVIFGIRLNEDDTLIGSCQLVGLDSIHRLAELQIRIGDSDLRGRGYGTEAVRLLVEHAFKDLGLRRVQLGVFATNAPAIRAYEKAGFEHEGVLREAAFIDGVARDVVVMGILAS